MLGQMRRLPSLLCCLALACTRSAPNEQTTTADDVDRTDAEKVSSPVAVGTPVFVMLGGSASRTTKPVANAVLGHSWGWDTATANDRAACEANAKSVGEQMWCGTEDKPEGAAELISALELAPGKSAFVTPEQIADWGIAAPTGPVWLFGPTQACKATVGRPLVGWYSIDEFAGEEEDDEEEDDEGPDLEDHFTIVELAWELAGCDDANESWAPIGMAAAEFEPTARWLPMKPGERERFEPASWTGVLGSEVAKLPTAAKTSLADAETVPVSAPEWWTQTFELPGTDVREIWFAAAWRGPDSKTPDAYQCDDLEFGQVFQFRSNASEATVIGRGSRGQLVGAVVAGESVLTMVWTDSLDYHVAKLEPAGLGESHHLSTGVYYPEDGGEMHYTLLPYCGP